MRDRIGAQCGRLDKRAESVSNLNGASFLYSIKAIGTESLTGTSGHSNANVRVNKHLATGGHGRVLGGIDVVASSKGAAAGGQASRRGQLLDLEGHSVHVVAGVGLDALGRR